MEELNDRSIQTFDENIELYIQNNKSHRELKEYLNNMYGTFLIGSNTDENDDLLLINTKKLIENFDITDKRHVMLFNTHSYLLQKSPLRIISKFMIPKIIESDKLKKLVDPIDWTTKIEVTFIYHGQCVILFSILNKWYLSTETTIYNMTDDEHIVKIFAETTKIDLSKLNKNNTYHFMINHDSIQKTLMETIFNINRKDVLLLYVLNNDLEIVNIQPDDDIFQKYIKPNTLYFSCIDELLTKMEMITIENKINKTLTLEGYIIKIFDDTKKFDIYMIYAGLYKYILENIPSKQNIYHAYIELYQTNKLAYILPYLSSYSNEIIHRINMSMRTLSKEILNMYHATRKMNNKELYNKLPKAYKRLLYNLHGIYITSKKSEVTEIYDYMDFDQDEHLNSIESKSITVHDVYYFLKDLSFEQLVHIYKYRNELLINNEISKYMNPECIYTLMQSKLMQE
jgi:hypothetical protein